MRLAFLSDVHGNLPALEAVLAAIDAHAPDDVWYGGDFVGYGPWPDECVSRLRARGIVCIRGNYDEKTLAYPERRTKWEKKKDPRKLAAFRHAYKGLSPESREFLSRLPATATAVLGGHRVLMVHSAPDSEKYGILPSTSPERLERIARDCGADVVLTGHTHHPFTTTAAGVLFVNAGSAGRPAEGDLRASFALLSLVPGEAPEARLLRVPYPVERVLEALPATGLDPAFAELYRTGRATF